MAIGFELTQPTYSPKEFASLYTAYVRRVSYATVLTWIELHRNSGGKEGLAAVKELRNGYYRIPAATVREALLAAGATEKGTT